MLLKAKERKEVLKDIVEGKTDMIVGTHALFTEDVIYRNLGLVITDEQHRFGVNQRANLKNKGIIGGLKLDNNKILVCATEMNSKEDIDLYLSSL